MKKAFLFLICFGLTGCTMSGNTMEASTGEQNASFTSYEQPAGTSYEQPAGTPDPDLISQGLEWKDNAWKYEGRTVSILYDNGTFYSNDYASEPPLYVVVNRDTGNQITGIEAVDKQEIEKLTGTEN